MNLVMGGGGGGQNKHKGVVGVKLWAWSMGVANYFPPRGGQTQARGVFASLIPYPLKETLLRVVCSTHSLSSQLSDKDVSLLEEKIRRYGKKVVQATPTAPPTTEAPPPSASDDQTAATGPVKGRGRGGGAKSGHK